MDRRIFTLGAVGALASSFCGPARAQVMARSKLGDAEVLVLSDGGFQLPLSMLARDTPLPQIEALTGSKGPSETVLNVTCLKRGDETVLFDCGAGANFLAGSGKLAASLEAAGIAPDSVTHVLFTHLHPDHLWGALDEFDSPAFPNAAWLAAKDEVAFWTDAKVYERLPEDRHAFAAGAQRMLKGIQDGLKTFAAGEEILPGIAAVATPGHTPGHVSFEIRQGSDRLLVLGDAATHPVASFAHPEWRPASDHDADLAVQSRRTVLGRAADEKLRVIGYHLPKGGVGTVERTSNAFRFVPAGA
jgi:glyoxylase-like metal-dependent hydrolase (beta-lactamase superfamily II)